MSPASSADLANVLLDLDRPDEARDLLRDIVSRRTRTLGASHEDTSSGKLTLAGTLRGSPARLDAAEDLYREIITGSASPELKLTARHNLAAVLAHRGHHHAALQAYRELILMRTDRQGGDHLDTWNARHNFTVVLHMLGDIEEAQACLTDVVAAYRRICGARHPTALDAQVDLAATKSRRGDTAAAISLLADALQGYRSTHGPHHPRVGELARTLAQLRR